MFESLASCFAFRCSASLNMTRPVMRSILGLRSACVVFFCDAFHLECSAADMQVALGTWDLDAGSGEVLVDQVVQVASEPARSVTHFAAPCNELEVDGAIAKFLQKRGRLRILQRG